MHLLLAVALLTAPGVAAARAADPIPPGALGPRVVRLTYEARAAPPDGTRVLELWLPLPREEDQAVLALRLEGTAPATVVHLAPSGDRAAYLHLADPKGTVTLTETATVARREVRAPVGVSRAALADIDAAAYAPELASAQGMIGFPLAYGDGPSEGPQEVKGYHCWAEFYAPGAGWVPVDISEARKHPELKTYFFGGLSGNRVLFTRARDALLEPDGAGRRLNYFIYPVARADGADVPSEWTLRYTDEPAAVQAVVRRWGEERGRGGQRRARRGADGGA